jgi:hypothetical protein
MTADRVIETAPEAGRPMMDHYPGLCDCELCGKREDAAC